MGVSFDNGGGGGVSDLKDTVEKISITFADSPYTIATTASCLISADTADGPIVILAPVSLTAGQIVQIEDDGLNAATNIITYQEVVDGVADPTIESDGGGMTVEYNGTRWRTRDTDDTLLKYHADLNEIQARGDAALVATSIKTSSGLVVIGADGSISAVNGVIGLAGTPVEKTVADATNIGVNVDQNGTSDFGNRYVPEASAFNTANPQTDASTPYAIIESGHHDIYSGYLAFNNVLDVPNQWIVQSTTGYIGIDIGTPTLIVAYRIACGGAASEGPTNWTFEGFNGATWDVLHTVTGYTGWTALSYGPLYTLASPSGYERYRVNVTAILSGTYVRIANVDMRLGSLAATSNTTDLAITTGAATTDSSSLVIYDENNDPITGTGKMNVGYEVDGGGFSTPVDQETFKALGGIASTTDFSIQPQAVGAQRWSKVSISNISTVFRASANGTIFEVASVSVFEVTATGVISSKQFYAETVALTAGASVATNCQLSNKFSLTPDQDFTLANPTNLKAGAEYTWIITNDATPRTITFDTAFKFAGGSAPSLTASAGAVDIFRGECDGTSILITQAILDLS